MSKMLIHIVISLFSLNFVSSMNDGFGQIHENERQSFQGFGNYSTGTQYAGFGYPHHKDYQYPPTPRFSNYEESENLSEAFANMKTTHSNHFGKGKKKHHRHRRDNSLLLDHEMDDKPSSLKDENHRKGFYYPKSNYNNGNEMPSKHLKRGKQKEHRGINSLTDERMINYGERMDNKLECLEDRAGIQMPEVNHPKMKHHNPEMPKIIKKDPFCCNPL
uniref:Uncharacterized protein n=1 Tax=Meloidogyne javanica TaxID=6303 RepID=A0A915LRX5_MELJA